MLMANLGWDIIYICVQIGECQALCACLSYPKLEKIEYSNEGRY